MIRSATDTSIHALHTLRRRARALARRIRNLPRPWLYGVSADAHSLTLTGEMAVPVPPDRLRIVLRRFRDETKVQSQTPTCTRMTPATFKQLARRLVGAPRYRFTVRFDVDWADVPPGLYAVELQVTGSTRRIHFHAHADAVGLTPAGADRTLCTFTERSVRIVRIEAHAIDAAALARLTAQARTPMPEALSCVIGEYTNTARDNGIALARGLPALAPDIGVTYAVEARNTDAVPTGTGNVVTWGTEAHLAACLDARVCAFTHHRTYVYPAILQAIAPDRSTAVRTLFLQHGVMAMKGGSVVTHYRMDRVDYDAVVVSSQRERTIFADHFGYTPDRVHATGLPRLDRLYRRAQTAPPDAARVLVAPTWRGGLEKMSSDALTDHPYFVHWRAAVAALRDRGLKPLVIGHPILRRHMTLMGAAKDEVHANTDFQDTLLRCSALVTDYSSVAWDALYAGRPAFLYHFDDVPAGFIPAHDRPGPVSTDAEALADSVAAARDAGWPFTHAAARDLAFDHIDDGNTARVIAVIRALAQGHTGP